MTEEEKRIYDELLEVVEGEDEPEYQIRLVISYILKNFTRKGP